MGFKSFKYRGLPLPVTTAGYGSNFAAGRDTSISASAFIILKRICIKTLFAYNWGAKRTLFNTKSYGAYTAPAASVPRADLVNLYSMCNYCSHHKHNATRKLGNFRKKHNYLQKLLYFEISSGKIYLIFEGKAYT